jgi:hypothetical protein
MGDNDSELYCSRPSWVCSNKSTHNYPHSPLTHCNRLSTALASHCFYPLSGVRHPTSQYKLKRGGQTPLEKIPMYPRNSSPLYDQSSSPLILTHTMSYWSPGDKILRSLSPPLKHGDKETEALSGDFLQVTSMHLEKWLALTKAQWMLASLSVIV